MTQFITSASLALLLVTSTFSSAFAETFQRKGWVSIETKHAFKDLNERLKVAIKANKMGRVNTASASAGAKGRGVEIPGNRVVGVYNNFFAVRMLKASKAAGMEAPIIYYLTENADKTTTLSYKKPSYVFEPYFADADPDLKVMAGELDVIFDIIATEAVTE